jgi:benzoyl-CoA reductase/2-hydroxyglutaryl-CoA dehydratase subunit BcrC/BadD/HgdB
MVVEKFRKADKELQIAVERQAYSVDLCPLIERNLTLLKSGECSDLTIRCGSHEYHLHRAMVCAQSNFLTLCCDGRFKVSSYSFPEGEIAY